MAGIKYWVWLHECALPNTVKYLLLAHFGSPEDIYYADEAEYALVEGLQAKYRTALDNKSFEAANRILGDCQRLGLRIITLQDADYPARLRGIFDPPILLYCRGNLPVIDEEVAIAMVGTRSATPYGIGAAEKLGYSLARQGALIVSGAARGIDTAALRGALRAGGKTVAMLGCGIDVIYPEENGRLYDDVAASGALLSEYPPGTPALGPHFPVRNRIISGLSLATVVVEAPIERSGALITAATALEQGRDVFAVPGPIDAPQSRGCNCLIADGAGLAAESWDILRLYSAQYPHRIIPDRAALPYALSVAPQAPAEAERETSAKEKQETKKKTVVDLSVDHGLTDDQMDLLRALSGGDAHVDDLIEQTQIPTRRVLSALTMLELDGYLSDLGGKRFHLNVEIQP